jgi:uncharacterized protein (TIGR04255 family)
VSTPPAEQSVSPDGLHFAHAPITEAVIDVRVDLPETVSLQDLAAVGDSLDGFGEKRERFEIAAQVTGGEAVAARAEQKRIGYDFLDDAKLHVFQARLDGFTVSRLRPYDTWREFSGKARLLWNAYSTAARPNRVTRIAVRYINRLELPLPFDDFHEFLNFSPEVPEALPQGVSQYFIHLELPDDQTGGMIVLNQTILPDDAEIETQSILPVLLDIDVFRTVSVSPDDPMVWETLETLRARKNEAFLACITDRTKELIS